MKNRYPGIQPFTANDRHLFCGRDREIKDLCHLVVLNRIVVLFGKSGTGKSSLLQAGVAPLLGEWFLQPLFIRLKNTNIEPEKQVYQYLTEGNYIPEMPKNLTLWEYFKEFDYLYAGESYTPVVVFDQLEELFTLYNAPQRQQFIVQLADLINGHIPHVVQQQIKADIAANPQLSINEIAKREASPKVKIILSIRSDFLYLLDRLSDAIPAILRCRYELFSLNKKAAQRAIEYPAQLTNHELLAPPFTYSQAAIDNILNTLSGKNISEPNTENSTEASQQTIGLDKNESEIEAFQLQLLCRHIEDLIIAQKIPLQTPYYIVKPELYGNTFGIQQILSNFYTQTLQKFSDQTDGNNALSLRQRVQNMIQEALLNNKRRIMQAEDYLCDKYQLTPHILAQLNNLRLLRKENLKNAAYYEISHDTLIKPIVKEYEKQQIAEKEQRETQEKIRLRAEREAMQRALSKERRRKTILGALLLLSICAFISALFAWRYSQQKERESQANYYASQALRNQNYTTQAIALADTACKWQQTPLALSSYWQSHYAYQWLWRDTLYYPPTYVTQPPPIVPNAKELHWRGTNKLRLFIANNQANELDNTVHIYTPEGKLIKTFQHTKKIIGVAISPDEQYLMTDVADEYQHLWHIATGKHIDSLKNQSGYELSQTPLTRTCFSPNSQYMLVLPNNNNLHIYNIINQKSQSIAINPPQNLQIQQVEFSPDSKKIAIKWTDQLNTKIAKQGKIAVIPIESNNSQNPQNQPCWLSIPNIGNAATSMAFATPNTLLTGDTKGNIQCWNVQNGKLLSQFQATNGNINDINTLDNGKYLLIAATPKQTNMEYANTENINCITTTYTAIWQNTDTNTTNYKHLLTLHNQANESTIRSYFNGNNEIITISNDYKAKAWQLNKRPAINISSPYEAINALFLPKNKAIALLTSKQQATINNLETPNPSQQPEWTRQSLDYINFVEPYALLQPTHNNKNGQIPIEIWNINTQQQLAKFTTEGRNILLTQLSASGNYALCYNDANLLTLWQTQTPKAIANLTFTQSEIKALSFAQKPENRYACILKNNDTTLQTSFFEADKLLKNIILPINTKNTNNYNIKVCSQINNTQAIIAVGSDLYWLDAQYKVKNQKTSAHSAAISDLALSPDERFISSAADDGTIKIWDTHNGECLHTFVAHKDKVQKMNFSDNGRYLTSAGQDGKVFVWQLLP